MSIAVESAPIVAYDILGDIVCADADCLAAYAAERSTATPLTQVAENAICTDRGKDIFCEECYADLDTLSRERAARLLERLLKRIGVADWRR